MYITKYIFLFVFKTELLKIFFSGHGNRIKNFQEKITMICHKNEINFEFLAIVNSGGQKII